MAPVIGCLEFCSVLNSDNPVEILRFLRRFVRIVRRERKRALFESENDDDDRMDIDDEVDSDAESEGSDASDDNKDVDDENEQEEKLRRRKVRKFQDKKEEKWMADTNSYNVPFVGTSMNMARGDTGNVVSGQWPTGLLKAYLDVSPRAAELVPGKDLLPPHGAVHRPLLRKRSDQKAARKLSNAIHVAYLEAVAELVTACVPLDKLRYDVHFNATASLGRMGLRPPPTLATAPRVAHQPTFLPKLASTLMKDQFPSLVQMLDDDTRSLSDYATPGVRKHCGVFVAPILNLLANSALSNTGTALEIARVLCAGSDRRLFDSRAILACVLMWKGGASDERTKDDDAGGKRHRDGDGGRKQSKKAVMSPRSCCLRLASILLESGDVSVQTYATLIPSPRGAARRDKAGGGAGDRYNSSNGRTAGIVNLALRLGLKQLEQRHTPALHNEILRLLRAIRGHLLPISDAGRESSRHLQESTSSLSNRTLAGLLGEEVMDRLSRLAVDGPPFEELVGEDNNGKLPHQTVMAGSDDYEDSGINWVAVESRRLIFALLGDPLRSPFLVYNSRRGDGRGSTEYETRMINSSHSNSLCRALHTLLTHNIGRDNDLEEGLSNVLRTDDDLIPLRGFVVDCVNTVPQLLPSLLRSLSICSDPKEDFQTLASMAFVRHLLDNGPPVQSCFGSSSGSVSTDLVLSCLLPPSLSKPAINKGLQSRSGLLVCETLKIIASALRRLEDFLSEQSSRTFNMTQVSLGRLEEEFRLRLPDIQTLFSVRSRFDPMKDAGGRTMGASTIVLLHLCDVFRVLTAVLPNSLEIAQLDWWKLLPDNEENDDSVSFLRLHPLLQYRLLQTIDAATKSQLIPSKTLRELLRIVLAAQSSEIKTMARRFAIQRVARAISSGNGRPATDEAGTCVFYEASLWVDGTTTEMLDEVCDLFDAALQFSVQHVVLLSQASVDTDDGACFSPLLSTAIGAVCATARTDFTRDFCSMVLKIATQMLLYVSNPKPLASVIDRCCTMLSAHDASPEDPEDLQKKHQEELLLLRSYVGSVLRNDPTSKQRLALVNALFNVNHVCRKVEDADSSSGGDERRMASSMIALLHSNDAGCILRHGIVLWRCEPSRQVLTLILSACASLLLRTEDEKVTTKNSSTASCHMGYAISAVFGDQMKAEEVTFTVFALASQLLHASEESVIHGRFQSWMLHFGSQIDQCNNGENTVETAGMPFQVASILLMTPQVPVSFSIGVVVRCVTCCGAPNHYAGLSASLKQGCLFFVKRLKNILDDEKLDAESIAKIVESACKFYATTEDNDLQSVLPTLRQAVAHVLTRALRREKMHGLTCAALLPQIVRIGPSTFVRVLLQDLMCQFRKNGGKVALENTEDATIYSDFAASIIDHASSEIGQELANQLCDSAFVTDKAWDSGLLDELLWQVVRSFGSRMHGKNLPPILIRQAATRIKFTWHQFADGKLVENQTTKRFVGCTVAFNVLTLGGQLKSQEASDLQCELLTALDNPRFSAALCNSDDIEGSLRALKGVVLFASQEGTEEHLKTSQRLVSSFFTLLCAQLARVLRGFFRGKKKIESNKSTMDPLPILAILLELASRLVTLSQDQTMTIRTAILTCLKYGIAAAAEESAAKVCSLCLKFVRILVEKLEVDASGGNSFRNLDILAGETLFMMVVSHSEFTAAVSGADFEVAEKGWFKRTISSLEAAKRYDAPKLELIRLLECCLRRAAGWQKFTHETWSAILSGYAGGLTEEDRCLRRLMGIMTRAASDENSKIFLDEMCWGPLRATFLPEGYRAGVGEEGGAARCWGWLPELLEIRRVRSTLRQFPVWDGLEPEGGEESALGIERDDPDEEGSRHDDLRSNDGEDGDGSQRNDPLENEDADAVGQKKTSRRRGGVTDWLGSGPDERYSPGFVLPLVLGALEAHKPLQLEKNASDEAGHEERESDEPDEDIEAFVEFAYRLCQKGALALTFGSLASRCPQLRRIAVATLGLFFQVVHSSEARALSTWSEVPQLSMVIDAVQRGLVVRRRMQLASLRDRGEGQRGDSELMVPMLPAVSAVFLAKASLIVANPSDELYAAMNRYFLRLEDFHGAFKDSYNVPAFMALYCSAGDDSDQLKHERLWALRLLNDGIQDEFCYDVIARRHIPSLLLTSLDTAAFRHGGTGIDETERGLHLDVLEQMLRNGGNSACSHLVLSVGLLPWIGGIIGGALLGLSTLGLRFRVLKLINTTLKAVLEHSERIGHYRLKTVRVQAVMLGRPIAEMYDVTSAQFFRGKDPNGDAEKDFSIAVCEALWNVRNLLSQDDIDLHQKRFMQIGIGVSSASALVASTHDSDQMCLVAGAVCALPVCDNLMTNDAIALFCQKILSVMMVHKLSRTGADKHEQERNRSRIHVDVLKRIAQLLTQLKSRKEGLKIIEELLNCRFMLLSRGVAEYDSWKSCLMAAVDATDGLQIENSCVARVSKDFLNSLVIEAGPPPLETMDLAE